MEHLLTPKAQPTLFLRLSELIDFTTPSGNGFLDSLLIFFSESGAAPKSLDLRRTCGSAQPQQAAELAGSGKVLAKPPKDKRGGVQLRSPLAPVEASKLGQVALS